MAILFYTDGRFSVNALGSDVLVFTFMGYTAREIPLNGRTTLSVKRTRAEADSLEDVIVIALGMKRESKN
jgi:hypothetical protein